MSANESVFQPCNLFLQGISVLDMQKKKKVIRYYQYLWAPLLADPRLLLYPNSSAQSYMSCRINSKVQDIATYPMKKNVVRYIATLALMSIYPAQTLNKPRPTYSYVLKLFI
jgi:hypothetical protein